MLINFKISTTVGILTFISMINMISGKVKTVFIFQHFSSCERLKFHTQLDPPPQTKNEPVHDISNNVVCATSKASDQPAQMRSLIRALASRMSIL